eukprot:CAMPEP_0119030246 /NCGR_PEP_ID=MMETSP1176-20130426/40935_1 /TAXON_ID=265551 /ORGANISM="Synedropsis recta cf, Strain CCMP1620" /LENGTH=305 /DNA_ID=CAMNT_0006986613 /DNA_START=2063 /DNA_END=2980 /DNA_ORIENTATION=-
MSQSAMVPAPAEPSTPFSIAPSSITKSARPPHKKLSDLKEVAQRQIENYNHGKAIILNVHVTHHAGTTLCFKMKQWGPTPDFYCMGGANWPETIKKQFGWTHNETPGMVKALRNHFHMISWEAGFESHYVPDLTTTDWEYNELVSVVIIRDPMDRLLAKDATIDGKGIYGDSTKGRSAQEWWTYANSRFTNNYALRVLSSSRKELDGENTDPRFVQKAKELLKRVTFVLDQACLDESIREFANIMNLTSDAPVHADLKRVHKPARERIGNDTLYEHLLRRNRRDIEVYEWSKKLALVNCSAIEDR